MDNDEFVLDDAVTPKGYATSKFYTASKDDNGESHSVRVNIPDRYHNYVERLVQQRLVPDYTSYQAFYKDSMAHRIVFLASFLKDPTWQQESLDVASAMIYESKARQIKTILESEEAALRTAQETLYVVRTPESRARVLRLVQEMRDNATMEETRRQADIIIKNNR